MPPKPPPRSMSASRPAAPAARPGAPAARPAPTAQHARSARAAQDAQARTLRSATQAPRAVGKLAAVLLSGVRWAWAPVPARRRDARDLRFDDRTVAELVEQARERLGDAVPQGAQFIVAVEPLFALLDGRAGELDVKVGFPVGAEVTDPGAPFTVDMLEPAHALEMELDAQLSPLRYVDEIHAKMVAFTGLPDQPQDIGSWVRIWQPHGSVGRARIQVELVDRVEDAPYERPANVRIPAEFEQSISENE